MLYLRPATQCGPIVAQFTLSRLSYRALPNLFRRLPQHDWIPQLHAATKLSALLYGQKINYELAESTQAGSEGGVPDTSVGRNRRDLHPEGDYSFNNAALIAKPPPTSQTNNKAANPRGLSPAVRIADT
jgi:hypothetical protein